MDKSRVNALTDAVVAIIMTIMALEFKVPDGPTLRALLGEVPYLFAFGISYFFIAIAWYNHHYMFALLNHVSRKIYWVNNVWMFTMALIPVATGWAGDYVNERIPEYFYLFIFTIWTIAFWWLSHEILREIEKAGHKQNAEKIRSMATYTFIGSYKYVVFTIVVIISTYLLPVSCLIFTLLDLISNFFHPNRDSDQLF